MYKYHAACIIHLVEQHESFGVSVSCIIHLVEQHESSGVSVSCIIHLVEQHESFGVSVSRTSLNNWYCFLGDLLINLVARHQGKITLFLSMTILQLQIHTSLIICTSVNDSTDVYKQ